MIHRSDFLVLGSGIGGLVFALRAAAGGTVTVLTKKNSADTNTNLAQGGIAAVMGPDDSPEIHLADTLRCGEGLSNERAARLVVERGPALVAELIEIGIRFSREEGKLALGREGGHTRRRIVHAKDATGREIERGLLAAIRKNRNIKVLEDRQVFDLIRTENGEIWGAFALGPSRGAVSVFLARTTLLATGGAGKVYLYTTNPDIASGDGIAMAYRAGARLANLEFVQFHPTCLYHPRDKSFLISEAVRGEGAVLRNLAGRLFTDSLAPRDVVARAIDREMKTRGERHVHLDLSAIPPKRIRSRFPNIYRKCLSLGIDVTKEPIPVVPAAHYMCGGVSTDLEGRTNLPRLYACGEAAHTGLHGANRLASNSLLEALVFATSAAESVAARFSGDPFPRRIPSARPDGERKKPERLLVLDLWDRIRTIMWRYVGIARTVDRLMIARRELRSLRKDVEACYEGSVLTRDLIELRSIAATGSLIVRCALRRRESRGLHYVEDYPHADPRFLRNTVVYRRRIG
ncbi:MAG: L-aspartate oxidase [Candidatus Eisenbacteria bacterium]|nr:L-aspartate oxidase [Candidatus Eisenbacteria bacterium]